MTIKSRMMLAKLQFEELEDCMYEREKMAKKNDDTLERYVSGYQPECSDAAIGKNEIENKIVELRKNLNFIRRAIERNW